MTRRKRLRLRLIAILAVACCGFSIAQAKKPTEPPGGGGGEQPTEVIYYADSPDTWQMNADGSGKTGVGIDYWGSLLEPSHQTYNGERLFLVATPGQTIPGALNVIREDGSRLPLLYADDDPGWQVHHDGPVYWVLNDANPDGMVSWVGKRLVEGVEEFAIIRAPTEFNHAGDLTGLDVGSIEHFVGLSDRYDWSPDGSRIVFSDLGALFIFDTESGLTMPLLVKQVYGSPQWSPDSLRIAYGIVDTEQGVSRIETIDLLDGTITVLASGRTQSPLDGTVVFYPHWSPDGSSLLYQFNNVRGYANESHIYLVNSGGKGKATNLTRDLDSGFNVRPYICAWRTN